MRLSLIFLILFCGYSFAAERVFMAENPNSMYENVLDSIIKSINEEDLEEYSKNFLFFNKKDKINVALFFLKHDPTVVVFEKHILQKTDSKVELAIQYQINCNIDRKNYKFSSIITMKKVDDAWKFSKEKIVLFNIENRSSCSSARNDEVDGGDVACFGGQCNLR